MKISLIAAMSENRVIGINNRLPWRLPDDMNFFMRTTKHRVVVMGRKNFDSLPTKYRPLPHRTNVILTRNPHYKQPGCHVCHSITQAYDFGRQRNEQELFVIGGGQIYEIAIKQADILYLTEIDAHIHHGEVFFPALDRGWQEASRKHHPADEKHRYAFDFVKYERVS